eukprot:Em0008g1138a
MGVVMSSASLVVMGIVVLEGEHEATPRSSCVLPLLTVVQKKAEQPWQRQAVLQLELTEEQKEIQEVFRKFRSILNKLTPQKLTELADATLQLKINTEERLRGVVDMIFTRAITETMYSGEVYANLCQVLAPFDVETVNTKGKLKTITFKRLLLSKCEQEFLKGMQEDEERKTMQKGVETAETEEIRKQRQMELEAAVIASRHRSLGNMRFIGELYKLKMLSEFTIHECMIRLLKSSSNETSLECFAKLMTITGTELDKEEAKPLLWPRRPGSGHGSHVGGGGSGQGSSRRSGGGGTGVNTACAGGGAGAGSNAPASAGGGSSAATAGGGGGSSAATAGGGGGSSAATAGGGGGSSAATAGGGGGSSAATAGGGGGSSAATAGGGGGSSAAAAGGGTATAGVGGAALLLLLVAVGAALLLLLVGALLLLV